MEGIIEKFYATSWRERETCMFVARKIVSQRNESRESGNIKPGLLLSVPLSVPLHSVRVRSAAWVHHYCHDFAWVFSASRQSDSF